MWSGTNVTHHKRFHCSASSELQSLCCLVVTLNDCVLVTHMLTEFNKQCPERPPTDVAMVGRLINRFKETQNGYDWPE